jgi:hypothetical protein
MYYFSYISMTYTAKNKLQKEALEYLKTVNRKVLKSELELEIFKEKIIQDIKDINAKHPRCTALNPHWYNYSGDKEKDYTLSGIWHICNFYLYQSK